MNDWPGGTGEGFCDCAERRSGTRYNMDVLVAAELLDELRTEMMRAIQKQDRTGYLSTN